MTRIPPGPRRGGSASVRAKGLSRRTFLADLGRVTLGAVVLGPVLAGCSAQDGGDAGDEEDADGADAASTPSDETDASGLVWERASFGFVSAYVLVRDGAALVFDTGTGDPGVAPITDALAAAGVGWDAVSDVLVSHRHGDHIGGLEQVAAEAPDAVVSAGEGDLGAVQELVGSARAVADGDVLLGVRVVATPGHTLGHLSGFDADTGVLLSGDAIVRNREIGGTTGEGIEASPPDFTADTEQALASVGVLADLAPQTILFGHGDPLVEDAASQLRDYADTL